MDVWGFDRRWTHGAADADLSDFSEMGMAAAMLDIRRRGRAARGRPSPSSSSSSCAGRAAKAVEQWPFLDSRQLAQQLRPAAAPARAPRRTEVAYARFCAETRP
jgi:hypothetical protein